MVSGYYAMEKPETNRQQLIALSGWLLLGGCFVAVNLLPSTAAKVVVIATLGLGGVAGWVQAGAWLADYSAANTQLAESRISNEQEYQERMNAEFRALGKDAPLWKYLGYMYISNEHASKRVPRDRREPRGSRREPQRVPRQRNARDGRDEVYRRISSRARTRARPGLRATSDLASVRDGGNRRRPGQGLSDRSYDDIRDLIRAGVRIQKGGGDLAPQMLAWRNYLKKFKNAAELVAEIDKALPRPGTR